MLKVEAPYDRSLLAELPWTSTAEAEAALARLFATYSDRRRWLDKATRISRLDTLATLLTREQEALARLAASEGGKPLVDSRIEVKRAISGVKKAASAISALTGREISMSENEASRGRLAYTYWEPRGVVVAISAFNHPLNLLIHQAVPAIASGCPVLVKPSSATPLTALAFFRLLREAEIGPEHAELALLEGEQARRLVSDPRTAFLSFIGSAEVGWRLRALLPPGASGAFEHGGVAPVIVDDSASLDQVIPLLTKGGFYHAGQVCVSVQRVFAPHAVASELAARLATAADALIVGDPLAEATEVGPLIRPSEVDRVETWVRAAESRGAKVVAGGQRLSPTMYRPTVLLNPPDDVDVSQREVFGPVVCVYGVENLDEAVLRANLPQAYFQAALFTNRLDVALDVGRRLHGTTVLVNDHTAFRVDWMPFGGHRDSGLGVGGIEPSMREMSLERSLIFRTT